MPKLGKDRRSARDDARERDSFGGLGRDQDYDWIKYLGEGRTASPAAPAVAPPAAPEARRPARPARPAAPSRPREESSAPGRPSPDRTEARAERSRVLRRPERWRPGSDADQEMPPSAGRGGRPGRSRPGYDADSALATARDYDDQPPMLPPEGYGGGRSAPAPDRPDRAAAALPPGGYGGGRSALPPERRDRDASALPREGYGGGRPALAPEWRDRSMEALPTGGYDGDWSAERRDRGGETPPPAAYAADAPSLPARLSRPVAGPAVRVTPGRPVDVSGHGADLLFNPAAEEYGQPLYSKPAPRSRSEPRMDTAEFASPLYTSRESGPLVPTRPRRPEPADDLSADTGRQRSAPADYRREQLPGRPEDSGPLTRRLGAAGTGPRRVYGPELDDETDPGRTARSAAFGSAAPPMNRRRGPGRAAAIEDVAEPAGTGPFAELAPDAISRDAGLPSRASTYGGRAPRALTAPRGLVKPRRPAKPRRPGTSGGPKARVRAGLGKARSRGGWRLSRKVLTFGVAAAVVLVVAVGLILFWPQPSHMISTPATLGSYTLQHENQTAAQLKQKILSAARGDVRNVVAAVYASTAGSGTGAGRKVIVFIGGNLTGNASASNLISAYMAQMRGAFTTNPGKFGGRAACAPGLNRGPAECAWADNDTFGVVVSASLSSTALANEMRLMRPLLEHVAK